MPVHRLPDGSTVIVCTRGRAKYCRCGKRAPLLCDYVMPTGKTCDRPLCESPSCRRRDGDKDVCTWHPEVK